MSTLAVVFGGGQGVWDDDRSVAPSLLASGHRLVLVAVNDAGAHLPNLDHWVTLHPEKFERWEAERRGNMRMSLANGFHPDYTRWSLSRHVYVDRIIRNWGGGSSGLLAVDVALNGIAADGVVLCGVPMDGRPNEFRNEAGWAQYQRYQHAWEKALPLFRNRVRSASGWTRDLLGAPDQDWLCSFAQEPQVQDLTTTPTEA